MLTLRDMEIVILLHGLGRTHYSMSILGRSFRKTGCAVLNFGYHSRRYTIAEQAELLHQHLTRLGVLHRSVNFVTHSLGSIIARKFLLDYSQYYRPKRMVMLGPPNQGSAFARKIKRFTFVPKILGPAFDELCDLQLESATDKIEVGVISGGSRKARGISPLLEGDNDGIVTVEETKLAGLKDHIIVPGLHAFLMFKPSVIRQVHYFLEHGTFQRG